MSSDVKTAEPVNGGGGPKTTAMTPAAPAKGQIARRTFGGQEIEASAETAGTALAAQARAMVEARFVMAMRNPRDWDDVRSKMLRACERPGFAGSMSEKVWGAAWYRKPVGDGAEGFSIRFAEEALRAMGNVDVQTVPVYEDDDKRIITVVVTDLESNLSFPTSLIVTKTVERRKLRQNETALRVRTNSRGEPTYIVEATEDDVFQKQQNLISKAIRNGALRLLPGDIQAECRARILAIRSGDAAKDPDGARKKVADAFAGLNVMPSHLKEYLGHDLSTATPAEIADLRDLYNELKDGKTTWAEVMAEVLDEREEAAGGQATPQKSGIDALTDKLKASTPAPGAVAAPAQPAITTTATPAPAAAPATAPASPPPLSPPAAPGPPAAAEQPEPQGAFGKAVQAEQEKRGGRQRTIGDE